MQSEPLLISSAKLGVVSRRKLSRGDITLLFFGLLFVIVGASDILSRLFTREESQVFEVVPVVEEQVLIAGLAKPFAPTKLEIPELSVSASVESVGRKEDGTMKAPSRFDTTAWFNEGTPAGGRGNVVVAGHLNNALDTSGVFEHLNDLSLGSTIVLKDEMGREARYVVREMTVYDVQAAPNDAIFSTSGPARLILITCDGAWDKGKRSYDKRLVVYADLESGN